MHIPDGYLSPIVSIGTGVVTVPGWAIATRRVQAAITTRTVPLLAIFSALCFTIMMFNVPVPGGTTAHGVGGTLAAIVLGPWGAAIAVSAALIIQALFFGDGGILAIFVNCLNMAFILPFVGYGTYRLLAGRSDLLSTRRVWAAGIGSYVGITVAALAVGIELGVQPILFSENGHALYSPYGLAEAVPAMLAAHAFGASIVEALITAFGLAYLQQRHPEYIGSLRRLVTAAGAPGVAGEGEEPVAVGEAPAPTLASEKPAGAGLWRTAGPTVIVGVGALIVAGFMTGDGDLGHAYGADWSTVDWPSVATMILVVAVIAAILIPIAWLVLPKRLRGVGTAFTAAAILAPLGLIAPGFAYGEGSTQDVAAAFGYVPKGLSDLSSIFSAPLAGYNLPLPFFSDANAALWQQALGYEIAGIIGILLLGGLVYGFGLLLGRRGRAADDGHGAVRVSDPVSRPDG